MSLFQKNAFGLDISDASIEALELKKSFGKYKIASYGRTELEPGIVRDGIILNANKLAENIVQVLKTSSPRPVRAKKVILSLPESRVLTYVFQFPANLEDDQIAESIPYEAEKVIPFGQDEIYSDYQLIKEDGRVKEVFYAACQRTVIDSFRNVLNEAGLEPVAFDMESQALSRSLTPNLFLEGVAFVDIGVRTTIVSIFDHHGIRETVNIPYAGGKLTEAVGKKLKVSPEKAEQLKRENGLKIDGGNKKVALALQTVIDKIIAEIRRTLNFYKKKTDFLINRAILCGGTSLLPHLDVYLTQKLAMKVERGNPLEVIHADESVLSHQPPILYATVIGLALRGVDKKLSEQGINLLPERKKVKKTKKKTKEEKIIREAPEGKNKRLIVLGSVFISLILIFIALLVFRKPLFERNVNYVVVYEEEPVAEAIPQEFTMTVRTAEGATLGADEIAGNVIETEVALTEDFEATGVRQTKARAAGKATIYNETGSNQTLVATTRLITSDGILYRLKNTVVVPANGNIEAEIYADQAGEEFELAPTDFTIPGLPAATQKIIYAKTTQATSGGLIETKVVTQADLDQATETMKQKSEADALNTAKQGMATDVVLVETALSQEVTGTTSSAKVDEELPAFTMTVKVKNKFLAMQKENIIKGLTTSIQKELTMEDLGRFVYTLKNYDADENLATVQVSLQTE